MTCEHGVVGACRDCGVVYAQQTLQLIQQRDAAVAALHKAKLALLTDSFDAYQAALDAIDAALKGLE